MLITAWFFSFDFWTTKRIWFFLIVGGALMFYFLGPAIGIYTPLIVFAILYNTIPEKLFGRKPPKWF